MKVCLYASCSTEIFVGFTQTVYTADENIDDMVDVCVQVEQPYGGGCPVNFAFDIGFSVMSGTAGDLFPSNDLH